MFTEDKAMKNTENPSTEQLEALKAWAALYGRNWKSSLRDAWMTGDYGSFEQSNYLQQIRNTFGPSWLVRFVLPTEPMAQDEFDNIWRTRALDAK